MTNKENFRQISLQEGFQNKYQLTYECFEELKKDVYNFFSSIRRKILSNKNLEKRIE